MFRPPEILLHIGSLEIRTYGVAIAGAILVSLWWAERRAKLWQLDSKLASDVFFWAIIGALVGARLGFVIQELGYFRTHVAEIPAIWTGGLSFHGGLIGAIASGLLVLKRYNATKRFWELADAAAAPLLLGAAIGRIGNWANQELYGYPTQMPWAIEIEPAHRLPGFEAFARFHPTFAYEAIVNVIGLVLLHRVVEKLGAPFKGRSFLFAIGWYGLARGITEIWRIGERTIGPLSLAQIISLVMIVIAVLLWLRWRPRPKTKDEEPAGDYQQTTRKTYDQFSSDFAKEFDEHFTLRVKNGFARRFAGLVKGKKLLDLGCGDGIHAEYFLQQGVDVTAVDISEQMIKLAAHRGVTAHVADIERLDFPNDNFDAVWAYNSLLHIPRAKIPKAVKDVTKILRVGGYLGLSMREGSYQKMEAKDQDMRRSRWYTYVTDQEIRALLERDYELIFHERVNAKNKYMFLHYLFRKR